MFARTSVWYRRHGADGQASPSQSHRANQLRLPNRAGTSPRHVVHQVAHGGGRDGQQDDATTLYDGDEVQRPAVGVLDSQRGCRLAGWLRRLHATPPTGRAGSRSSGLASTAAERSPRLALRRVMLREMQHRLTVRPIRVHRFDPDLQVHAVRTVAFRLVCDRGWRGPSRPDAQTCRKDRQRHEIECLHA